MNNQRRKAIDAIITRLENELSALVESVREEIDTLRDEEQEYYDNMPESFQSGEKGDMSQRAIDNLEEAISILGDFATDYIVSVLNAAQE